MSARLLIWLALSTFSLLTSATSIASDIYRHDIKVTITPAKHLIKVLDRIRLPDHAARELTFSLHRGLNPRSPNKSIEIFPLTKDTALVQQHFKLRLPPGINTFVLEYEGIIHHSLNAYGKDQARGFRDTLGLISTEGIYLDGASYWYPHFPDQKLLNFSLSVDLPKNWDAVSQGKRIQHEQSTRRSVVWDCLLPQQEIYLIAAQFTEYISRTNKATAMVFLRKPDENLANKYLETTHRYIQMYENLLAPYPYNKFALVENFWETGFGMPSFTLLGSKVIRLPFILHSSYPHEILHNWWGNGVYVDYSSGNWSEGLTAYLADHLIKEQQGQGTAYRQQSLQKYTDYAAEGHDFPLTQFRDRHSSASEAVGYGKALMLFHMLRQKLGDEIFVDGLREFYQQHVFKTASFDDLRIVLEQVSGKNLIDDFNQWVKRTGAPALQLSNAKNTPFESGYRLSFELSQTQDGEPYQLSVPLAITFQNRTPSYQTNVSMNKKQQTFDLILPAQPLRLDVDPEFDLFRKLARQEIPPALTQVFGSHKVTVILPTEVNSELDNAYRKFAKKIEKMGPGIVSILKDNELDHLPGDQSILLLGWENRWISAMPLSQYGVSFDQDEVEIGIKRFSRGEASTALTMGHGKDGEFSISLVSTDLPKALSGLARKLPHYHKYSFLVFTGSEPQNRLKGRWPIESSPMTVAFGGSTKRGQLKTRKPLAISPPIFDGNRMMDSIQFLSSDDLKGRGFGEPGLDLAAEYIAQQFQKAGLEPAGDSPGSYFQNWLGRGGDPERKVPLKNVVAVIPGTHPNQKTENVVVGAHYDHLGFGWPDVRENNYGKVHHGADDNASGIAVLLELARILNKVLKPDRNIVFVAFSGEEAGRQGSRYYIKHQKTYPIKNTSAMVNLDTVGRLGENKLLVLGAQSALEWPHIFRGIGYVTGIPIEIVAETLDSSDQISFQESGIPAIQLFSGVNLDYHRPTDTSEKIDPKGLIKVAKVAREAIEYLATREEPLTSNVPIRNNKQTNNPRKVSLGSIPDFTYKGKGYGLSGVIPDSPAAVAGLRKGDVILKMGGTNIHNVKDASKVLKSMQSGERLTINFLRKGETLTTQATLKSK